jgi:hypothetical protein
MAGRTALSLERKPVRLLEVPRQVLAGTVLACFGVGPLQQAARENAMD